MARSYCSRWIQAIAIDAVLDDSGEYGSKAFPIARTQLLTCSADQLDSGAGAAKPREAETEEAEEDEDAAGRLDAEGLMPLGELLQIRSFRSHLNVRSKTIVSRKRTYINLNTHLQVEKSL